MNSSFLAGKVTFGLISEGRLKVSPASKWLAASTQPPSGIFSVPSILTRNHHLTAGRTKVALKKLYHAVTGSSLG